MRSFWRFTWNRAIGIAAEARMDRIATVTISSTSVRPRSLTPQTKTCLWGPRSRRRIR